MDGTDRAVKAIMNYSKDGLGKELDADYLNDNIQIYLMNEKPLYNGVHNTRRPAHSVAYEGLLKTINMDNNENLTSPQIKAGFKKLGLDFKEVIKPTVEFIEEQRKEAKEESKTEKGKKLVKTSHIEDIGGGNKIVFGELEDNTYFNEFDGNMYITDVDMYPIYEKENEVDKETLDKHTLWSINTNDFVAHNTEELNNYKKYYDIISQTKQYDSKTLNQITTEIENLAKELTKGKKVTEGIEYELLNSEDDMDDLGSDAEIIDALYTELGMMVDETWENVAEDMDNERLKIANVNGNRYYVYDDGAIKGYSLGRASNNEPLVKTGDIEKEFTEGKTELNEERYYYGEIEDIKTKILSAMSDLDYVGTVIRNQYNNKDNEYTEEQIKVLKTCQDKVVSEINTELADVIAELGENFANRIRTMTPEEKEYIAKHKDEIPKEESKKEELFDVPADVRQDSVDKGLCEENKKVTESRTIFSTFIDTDEELDTGFIWEDFENMIVPDIKKQCNKDVLIMAGTVGRWNGNFDGGTVMDIDDLASFGNVDDIEIVADDGNVFWKGIHHDGEHIMQLFTIPQDEEAKKKICKDLGITEWLEEIYTYDTPEDCMEDALTYLDSPNDLEDIFTPDAYAKAKEYFTPIKAIDILAESKKITESTEYNKLDNELNTLIKNNATDKEFNDFLEDASLNDNITNEEYTNLVNKAQDTRKIENKKVTEAEEDNSSISTTVPKLTPEQEKEIEDQFYKDQEGDTTFHNEDGSEKTIMDYLEERVGQELSVGELNTILQSIFGHFNKIFLQTGDLYNANLDETQELVIFEDEDMYTIKYDIISLDDALIEITDVNID